MGVPIKGRKRRGNRDHMQQKLPVRDPGTEHTIPQLRLLIHSLCLCFVHSLFIRFFLKYECYLQPLLKWEMGEKVAVCDTFRRLFR